MLYACSPLGRDFDEYSHRWTLQVENITEQQSEANASDYSHNS